MKGPAGPEGFWLEVVLATPREAKRATHGARGHLTLCLVFCRLLRRIFRISSSLSLDRAGRMRSTGRVLGLMFLLGQTGFRATLRRPQQDRTAACPAATSGERSAYARGLSEAQGGHGRGTHWMETVETAEGILPMPPLSTSSIACFISIL